MKTNESTWDHFQGAPGDRPHEDKRVFPGTIFRVHQETDHMKTEESSPGTLFRVHQKTDHMNTKESSPGTLFRVHQETDHMKTNESSPGTLFRVHQETDHMKTNKSSPGHFSGCTGDRLHKDKQYLATNTCTHWGHVSTSAAGTVSFYT